MNENETKDQKAAEAAAWKEVCERQGEDPIEFIPYKEPKNGHQRFVNGHAMMALIVKNRRKGEKIDWNNGMWDKYVPWMDMSGSGPSFYDYHFTYSFSSVGSRLCSLSNEVINEIAQTFPSILYDMFQEED